MTKKEKDALKKKLLDALLKKNAELKKKKEIDTKIYEAAFQKIVEDLFPDKCWWEATGCQIFNHLVAFKDPMRTCMAIAEGLKY